MRTTLRTDIRKATCTDEPVALKTLLAASAVSSEQREKIRQNAIHLVERCRQVSHKAGTLDAFLQEFGLSNKEGIALMCLAEALLRVPDEETADRLIAEKIQSGDWGAHKGKSGSRFVNASVWGLMLTGRVVRLDKELAMDTASWMRRLVSSLGEPVVRKAVLQAMRIMGGQYVMGRTISQGLKKGASDNAPGTLFSFDMLGEGARTAADAQRYFDAYANAISELGKPGIGSSANAANGISVKLSALHPRYEWTHRAEVMSVLVPRALDLARAAARAGIGFNIDAEEADRLDLSLDVIEAMLPDPELAGWDGFGVVIQAYGRRAGPAIDWLYALAERHDRRIMVRLVKGAYWDAEIKIAQERGLPGFPVFTRKDATDVSYMTNAGKLLSMRDRIYPQFATHNAHTVAAVLAMALGGIAFAQDEGTSWQDLSAGQREVLGQFADDWDSLPADRQDRLSRGAERWSAMTPEQRTQARERFTAWRSLSVERRELIRERADIFRSLSPEEQQRIRENYRMFKKLNRERRQMLRDRYRDMTPEQRQLLRDRLQQRPRARPRD